ncbi:MULTISPECIES: hypothetical protein [unclassified Sphingomonas]|jgi:hypothetical protein|uniref:hypothetical protein n=1 Tax=Sphingomonas TaxID=13687 RepID=UPI0009673E5F|nr:MULTISPECIES: hypothetical protein [unclassified Sphingomonas]MBN8812206.1 hypothetical protein [Sphingomonas sp.]OJY47920.1 MAG: hypothetical protein BGP17_01820 [Sphingomonas sp. 67-41]
MRLDIVGEASAALLCRLLGLAAQHDLTPPEMEVRLTGDGMAVRLDLGGLDGPPGRIVAEKMLRCIGVEAVALDGAAL